MSPLFGSPHDRWRGSVSPRTIWEEGIAECQKIPEELQGEHVGCQIMAKQEDYRAARKRLLESAGKLLARVTGARFIVFGPHPGRYLEALDGNFGPSFCFIEAGDQSHLT